MIDLRYHNGFGRVVRCEPLEFQGISTLEFLLRAVRVGDAEQAAALAEYWQIEMSLSYGYYSQWMPRIAAYAAEQDEGIDENKLLTRSLSRLVGNGADMQSIPCAWEAIKDRLHEIKQSIFKLSFEQAECRMHDLRDCYESLHDTQVAWSWLLLTELADTLGEEQVEVGLRATLRPWVAERYRRFVDGTPWEEVVGDFLLAICESMRCHLSGPRRWGEFTVREEAERWSFTFDPCGSGCQAWRGTARFGPLTCKPYNAGATQQKRCWTWGKAGISYYCAHCCLLHELLPMEICGYPMKITVPPSAPGEATVWYVYKRRESIPAEYFERVGRVKPNP